MLETLFSHLQGSPLALFGLWGLLVFCGIGLPLPEDTILIAAGMLASAHQISWVYTSALMYVGILAGDSIIFALGRYFGSRLLEQRWTQRILSPTRRERVQEMFKRYGVTVFFVARFLPGLRAPIFCTAGAMRAKYGKFLLMDGLAALVSAPLFVWLGHYFWLRFGDDLARASSALARARSLTLAAGLACFTLVIVGGYCLWRKTARA